MSSPLRPIPEPATILARPSLVSWVALAWVVCASFASVTLGPPLGVAAPWLLTPLVVTAAVTGGLWSAAAWAATGGLMLDLMPPGSSTPGASIVPGLVSAVVVARFASVWAAGRWAAPLLGALAFVVLTLTNVLTRSADLGALVLDPAHLGWGAVTSGLLTGLLAPPWVRWVRAQRRRGRA